MKVWADGYGYDHDRQGFYVWIRQDMKHGVSAMNLYIIPICVDTVCLNWNISFSTFITDSFDLNDHPESQLEIQEIDIWSRVAR